MMTVLLWFLIPHPLEVGSFIDHFRSYEIYKMEKQLQAAGLMPMYIQKVGF